MTQPFGLQGVYVAGNIYAYEVCSPPRRAASPVATLIKKSSTPKGWVIETGKKTSSFAYQSTINMHSHPSPGSAVSKSRNAVPLSNFHSIRPFAFLPVTITAAVDGLENT